MQSSEQIEALVKENEQLRQKLNTISQLTVDKVKIELLSVQCVCGQDSSRHGLKWVGWESDYNFENGTKSPSWRNTMGEIGYIVVKPFDTSSFIITATGDGFFVNKGYKMTDSGAYDINYEKDSETFPSLITLLQNKSQHFSTFVNNALCEKESETMPTGRPIAENEPQPKSKPNSARGNKKPHGSNSEEHSRGNSGIGEKNHADNGELREDGKFGYIKRKKDKKNLVEESKGMEPSTKWKQITPEKGAERNVTPLGRREGRASPAQKSPTKSRHRAVDDSDDESQNSGEEEEAELQDKRQDADAPPEQWQIQKLVRYLKAGNQTATIIAICALRDFDLMNETNQLAIRNVGGLEILVNLLDTNDTKCKIGSLSILKQITSNYIIRKLFADLDGMRPLLDLLHDDNVDVQCLAAETIANCAKYAKNRRIVRKYGGIRSLVRLLNPDKSNPNSERIAVSGSHALWTCSKSQKNKEAIRIAGSIPLLEELLKIQNEKLRIPVVGILEECASEEQYRIAIRSSGMIKFLVENLSSKNQELQAHCASAIFKCAEDAETRVLVREFNGITPLVALLDNLNNKEILAAATGAIWKVAQDMENVNAFNKLNAIKKLVALIDQQPEEVLVNVVGALAACSKAPEGRQAIRDCGGITPLVGLLKGTNQSLLVNVTSSIGASAQDADSMAIIDRLDGVRLLWSLLKSPNPAVQASAAWAISPCVENDVTLLSIVAAKDAGEMVRSFVGGLELIVSLLKSDNVEVLASVCAAITQISRDEENLAVITDHGVVPMLAKLTQTRHDKLRQHLAEAIARCCHWGNNRIAFGSAGAVAPLVKYLKSPQPEVHRATAQALHQLSKDADNCITMHENGVVQMLLGMVGSSDTPLQEAAAGTIGNIRRLALASDKARKK